jgi:hypothetical protein
VFQERYDFKQLHQRTALFNSVIPCDEILSVEKPRQFGFAARNIGKTFCVYINITSSRGNRNVIFGISKTPHHVSVVGIGGITPRVLKIIAREAKRRLF